MSKEYKTSKTKASLADCQQILFTSRGYYQLIFNQPMGATFTSTISKQSMEMIVKLERKLKMESLQKKILIVNFIKTKANLKAKIANIKQQLQELMKA